MTKVAEWFDKTKTFLNEVGLEMRKVTWPTREQVKNYTIVVVIASAVLAVVIGIWDQIVGFILLKLTGIRG